MGTILMVGTRKGLWIGRSDDRRETWQETPGGGLRFPDGSGATVERVWQVVPGTGDGVVYAGTEPGAVWRSVDGGETFALEEALWNHPQKPEWGAGFGGQAFHTILPHPTHPGSVTGAIST